METKFIMKETSIKFLISKFNLEIPNFQRKFVWSKHKQKSLIISIISGFPIGVITLFNDNDSYIVIDGLQRINTIEGYLKNPSSVLSIDEYNKYIEDKINIFCQTNEINLYRAKKAIKNWYNNLNEIDKYSKVFHFLSYLKQEKVFQNYEENYELIEEMHNIAKEFVDIVDQQIGLMYYTGDKDNLPELFQRINSGTKALSKYDVLHSIWVKYKLDSEVLKVYYSFYLKALKEQLDDYNILDPNIKLDFDIFKCLVGLTNRICCIENNEKLFLNFKKFEYKSENILDIYPNREKLLKNDDISFGIYSTLIKGSYNKANKSIEYLFNDVLKEVTLTKQSKFIKALNDCIIDSIYELLKYDLKLNKSTNHSIFVISGYILANYTIDYKNLVIHRKDPNCKIMEIILDFEKSSKEGWFVGDDRQVSDFNRRIKEIYNLII